MSEQLTYLKRVLSDFDDYCAESGHNCWTRENILCAIEREKEKIERELKPTNFNCPPIKNDKERLKDLIKGGE